MGTPAEETYELLQSYAEEARAIEKSLINIAWYMRGSVDIDQAHRLTYRQRRYALELIEENIDRTGKTGVMMH